MYVLQIYIYNIPNRRRNGNGMFVLGHGGQTRHPRSSRIRFKSMILVHSLYTHTKSPFFFVVSHQNTRVPKRRASTTGPSVWSPNVTRPNERPNATNDERGWTNRTRTTYRITSSYRGFLPSFVFVFGLVVVLRD